MIEEDSKDELISSSKGSINRQPKKSFHKMESAERIDNTVYSFNVKSELTMLSNHVSIPISKEADSEAIAFYLTIKKDTEYKWKVVRRINRLRNCFMAIKEEQEKKKIHISPLFVDIFHTVDNWTLEELKGNLPTLNEYIQTLYMDEEIQKNQTLNEYLEISKTSFNSYNAGKKPKEGHAYKKADPRCWRRVFGFLCKCIECLVFSQYNKRWFVLKDDMICYLNSSTEDVGKNVYWFDEDTKVSEVSYIDHGLLISNVSRELILKFPDDYECKSWLMEIRERLTTLQNIIKNNPYKSYTNEKKFNTAEWFIDGEDYFKDLQQKLLKAKESVFITDWWLSPEVYLVRPVKMEKLEAMQFRNEVCLKEGRSRLMDILNHLASSGVKVYVLVYCEMSLALTLNSKHSEISLINCHKDIQVTRHPLELGDLLWSHHEKLVIIDQSVGYVGGLDLCWGRFDTHDHTLIEPPNDDHCYMFPGIDYSNGRIRDFNNVGDYLKEAADRKTEVRMPWHDVHSRIEGPAVADIARHFVERWNFARFEDRKMAIVDVKNSNALEKSGKFPSNWLGKIVSDNEKNEENKEGKETELMGNSLLKSNDEEKKEPLIPPAKAKMKMNFLINQKGIEDSNKAEPHSLLESSNKNSNDDDDDDYDEDDLRAKFLKGKTVIDDDHLMIKGAPAENIGNNQRHQSVAYNQFVQNYKAKELEERGWFDEEPTKLEPKFNFNFLRRGKCTVQVLRSGCAWSTGIRKVENSILKGYYHLIDNSKHYLYIENQFFVSKSFSEEERKETNTKLSNIVENEIAYHIRKRIERAYHDKEKFHVFVFIPLLPGFAGEPETSSTLQIILKHTLAGISNNYGYSMFEKLESLMGDEVHQYLTFFSLRTHTVINSVPTTELIYIHSKVMIVDDHTVIIGSANINDRSMLGTRDSEYAIILKEDRLMDSQMDGKDYKAAKFAATFRQGLFSEHLGIQHDDPILIDPLDNKFYSLLTKTAKNNTLAYRAIFGCYPDDEYTSFAKLKAYKIAKSDDEVNALQERYKRYKDNIVGHIVEFPTKFLTEEKLGINFFSVENLVPEKNFT